MELPELQGRGYLALGLANIHVDQLWSLDTEKVDRTLSGYCLCNERLASACNPLHFYCQMSALLSIKSHQPSTILQGCLKVRPQQGRSHTEKLDNQTIKIDTFPGEQQNLYPLLEH